jgi:hypothetical protein
VLTFACIAHVHRAIDVVRAVLFLYRFALSFFAEIPGCALVSIVTRDTQEVRCTFPGILVAVSVGAGIVVIAVDECAQALHGAIAIRYRQAFVCDGTLAAIFIRTRRPFWQPLGETGSRTIRTIIGLRFVTGPRLAGSSENLLTLVRRPSAAAFRIALVKPSARVTVDTLVALVTDYLDGTFTGLLVTLKVYTVVGCHP